MKLGFGLPIGGAAATADNVSALARHAEALGYHSLWVFQRLLCPVSPLNTYYGAVNEAWPEPFRSTFDPIVTLAFLAAQTRRVRLGTSVLVAPFYSPIVLGKQLATLDIMSGGRLTVGLGIGWSRDEYDAAGTPFAQRGERADEFIQCLDAIWTQPEVTFKGVFYFVPSSRVEPKPLQKPRPPLLIGGYSEPSFRRAGRFGDGYTGGNMAPEKLAHIVRRVREHAAGAGRDPARVMVASRGSFKVTSAAQSKHRAVFCGSLEDIRDDVKRYEDAGATEVFLDPTFQLSQCSVTDVFRQMEALAPRGA
ncbi:MAG TPA: LLM class F420-dependent oxidoreductase [Methylomirabilota bacterium]|jgi:probable F420-dependent oxidoreductase|nr:LLM class F420-dependent oxidoreductase [Methylomirabilota bacterium]